VQKIIQIPGGVRGYTVPSVVVITARYSGYFDERDLFVPFIDASHASMGFQLALETMGLSSVCINWPQIKKMDSRIRSLISLEEDECVVMLLGVGYPDPQGLIPYSGKKDAGLMVEHCT